jgi:hypothetical protein
MFDPVATKLVPKLLGSWKAIANRFDLTKHFAVYIPDNTNRTVDGDHIVNG